MSLVIFITISVSSANAQKIKITPEKRAAHITKELQKTLNLSAPQTKQVSAIFLKRAIRVDSLLNNPSSIAKRNRLAQRDIILTARKGVMAVLNDTQKRQFMAWEKNNKERRMQLKATKDAKSKGFLPGLN